MDLEELILSAVDSITTANYSLIGAVIAVVAVIFYLIVVSWIWVDSSERTTSRTTRILYLLIGLIPVLGWIIYLIVRPPETIDEIYWGDLERRYLKFETLELSDCPKCGSQLYPGYIYCPNCKYPIKEKCPECGTYVSVEHKYCMSCGYQMKDRAVKEELPDALVMQQQIDQNKEEVHETIKAGKSKYKQETDFVSRVGKSVIKGYALIGRKVKGAFISKSSDVVNVQTEEITSKQNKKKHKKKRRK